MIDNNIITRLNSLVDAGLTESMNLKEITGKLQMAINHLIITDFEKLVTILYKIDIDEDKLKKILKENPATDAAEIMASLILEREIQKSESRKRNKF